MVKRVLRWGLFLAIPLLSALQMTELPQPVIEAQTYQLGHYQHQVIDGDRLVLLNWNIHKELNAAGWRADLAQIQQDHQPTLITLQEANLDISDPNLPLPAGFGLEFAANLVLNDSEHAGVATASREAPSASQAVFSSVTEPLLASPKLFLLSEYPLAGRKETLLVANIHAINFVDKEDYGTQLGQLSMAISAHDGPLLVVGDFNSWNPTRLTHLAQLMAQHQLQPVPFPNPVSSFMGNPLDHVFFSRHFELTAADTLDRYDSSDHLPLLVDLKLMPEVQ
ncbi:endonuclease/exonuclease/phosphatase family protein [Ferrimonas gelatinilytica]|uniref:Endonuclease/exonuclease/phosphatase family protein n=1 Tax=Ferrimonas gelatinilytica TaxID=1255257 RepID=A0ABP9RW64_9GAMM